MFNALTINILTYLPAYKNRTIWQVSDKRAFEKDGKK